MRTMLPMYEIQINYTKIFLIVDQNMRFIGRVGLEGLFLIFLAG
jgi:hypothetical protein